MTDVFGEGWFHSVRLPMPRFGMRKHPIFRKSARNWRTFRGVPSPHDDSIRSYPYR
jgi:hypothetical protein